MAITQLNNDLIYIRELFLQTSGRTDLVNPTTLANTGANDYINAGQRHLDRMVEMPKTLGRRPFMADPGQVFISAPEIRSVHAVTYVVDGGRGRLTKQDYSDWMAKFPKLLSSSVPSGMRPPLLNADSAGTSAPTHYAVAPTAISPDMARPISEDSLALASADTAGLMIAGHAWSGVVIGPAPMSQMSITIHGKFFSPRLIADSDQSYWTLVEPMLLLWASMYLLEVQYRNREGQADWKNPMMERITAIDWDSADEEWAEVSKMEG